MDVSTASISDDTSIISTTLGFLPKLPLPLVHGLLTAFAVMGLLVWFVHIASPKMASRKLRRAMWKAELEWWSALEGGLGAEQRKELGREFSALQITASELREAGLRASMTMSGTARAMVSGMWVQMRRCRHQATLLTVRIQIAEENERRQCATADELGVGKRLETLSLLLKAMYAIEKY
ncbi:hypothetical protein C8F01DRAFT_1134459 [Mycena amicta]|nr:hypothetical protein C8F01DRAFT_1134459 [Mycena amicta]